MGENTFKSLKIVTFIYTLIFLLATGFFTFAMIDYIAELEILGRKAQGDKINYFSNVGPAGIIDIFFCVFVALFFILFGLFISTVVATKKGKLPKVQAIISIIIGGIASTYFIGLPLLIVSLLSIVKISNIKKTHASNENDQNTFKNDVSDNNTQELANDVFKTSDTYESSKTYSGSAKFATSEKFKLEITDFFVSSKDFRQFKRTATQEELITVALSTKYQMTGVKAMIKCLIAFIGAPLSIVLGVLGCISFGWFAIFLLIGGYLVFSIMAMKQIGYESTYNACYRKLDNSNKEFVKKYFKEPAWLYILNTIIRLVLLFETLPYQAIMMLITTMIPKTREWGIAKGSVDSVVIAIPKGYDIGGLESLNGYYQSFRFYDGYMEYLDEAELERIASYRAYEGQDGKTYYSADGVNFYERAGETGSPVATSDDGGQTITKIK